MFTSDVVAFSGGGVKFYPPLDRRYQGVEDTASRGDEWEERILAVLPCRRSKRSPPVETVERPKGLLPYSYDQEQ